MKLKFQSLLLIMTLASAFFSCKDEDDKKLTNAYLYDGKTIVIKTAVFENNTHGDGGGYTFWFSPETYEGDALWSNYVGIEIPKEMMGAKFELKDERLHDWSWWFEYWVEENDLYYEGFGDEDEMEDVKSGTMSAINRGDGKFDIELDIVFTDGKTLKLTWSGKMVDWDERESSGRKATLKGKSNSPNQ